MNPHQLANCQLCLVEHQAKPEAVQQKTETGSMQWWASTFSFLSFIQHRNFPCTIYISWEPREIFFLLNVRWITKKCKNISNCREIAGFYSNVGRMALDRDRHGDRKKGVKEQEAGKVRQRVTLSSISETRGNRKANRWTGSLWKGPGGERVSKKGKGHGHYWAHSSWDSFRTIGVVCTRPLSHWLSERLLIRPSEARPAS